MRVGFSPAASLVFVLIVGVARVDAQDSTWSGRVRVTINGGSQPASTSFEGSTTSLINLETATTRTGYEVPSGLTFDGGVAVRLAGNLGVGVAISSFTGTHEAGVSASIPHPFFFSAPRQIGGRRALRRSELAAHVQAVYVIAAGERFDVAVAAGPTIFQAEQDVVSDVTYAEAYPYDAATFIGASAARTRKTVTGVHASADVTVHLARHVGVGALARFSRASLEFAVPGHSETVKSDAGGLQVGGGLRLFF